MNTGPGGTPAGTGRVGRYMSSPVGHAELSPGPAPGSPHRWASPPTLPGSTPEDEGGGRWLAHLLDGRCPLPLGPDDIARLDRLLRPRTVDAGTVLARAGEPARLVWLVREGRIDLVRRVGGRPVVIGTLAEGDALGDVAVLLDRPHDADAAAATDVVLWELDGADLWELVARRSPLALRWLLSLASRVAEGNERMHEVLAGHLDLRVAAVLGRRADAGGRVDLTQARLAQLLGVQRSSVNEAVRRLETRGLVRRGYGHVVVLDGERLRALVED